MRTDNIDRRTRSERDSTGRARAALASRAWTLERFGFSPSKAPRRIANPGAPKVYCVSIPKSGTHLLERALCLHPKLYRKLVPTISDENIGRYNGFNRLLRRLRPGQIIVSHLRYQDRYRESLDQQAARGIFLIRDPHAIVVSQAHYVARTRSHRNHEFFLAQPSVKHRVRIAITGDAEHRVASIAERLEAFSGWLDAGCLVVRFEDLIGPEGGGDRTVQIAALRSIYEFLGIDAPDALVVSVARTLFSSASPTFRTGTVGEWRDSFDADLERLISEVASEAMTRYGYGRLAGAP
jgi:Sulfotransferase domain